MTLIWELLLQMHANSTDFLLQLTSPSTLVVFGFLLRQNHSPSLNKPCIPEEWITYTFTDLGGFVSGSPKILCHLCVAQSRLPTADSLSQGSRKKVKFGWPAAPFFFFFCSRRICIATWDAEVQGLYSWIVWALPPLTDSEGKSVNKGFCFILHHI